MQPGDSLKKEKEMNVEVDGAGGGCQGGEKVLNYPCGPLYCCLWIM